MTSILQNLYNRPAAYLHGKARDLAVRRANAFMGPGGLRGLVNGKAQTTLDGMLGVPQTSFRGLAPPRPGQQGGLGHLLNGVGGYVPMGDHPLIKMVKNFHGDEDRGEFCTILAELDTGMESDLSGSIILEPAKLRKSHASNSTPIEKVLIAQARKYASWRSRRGL